MRIGPGAAEIAAAPDGLHLYITHPAYGKITVLDKETLTARVPATWKLGGKQYVGVYSGIGGWIGLPVTAGLDLGDKFGAIGATAMTKPANLQFEPQGGELNVFRIIEQSTTLYKNGRPVPYGIGRSLSCRPRPTSGDTSEKRSLPFVLRGY